MVALSFPSTLLLGVPLVLGSHWPTNTFSRPDANFIFRARISQPASWPAFFCTKRCAYRRKVYGELLHRVVLKLWMNW